MAVIKPPITGDLVLDSWLNQITQALNTGVVGTSAGGTSQVKSGASGFNTATIYLYARTSTDSAPSAMNEETTYTYKTGVLVNGASHDGVSNGLGPNDVWFRNVPSGAGGYLWVTTVHVADTAATESIASGSWSAVTKLAEKGEQGKFAVELYKRSSSTPSAPTDVTWTYATGAISGTNSASWALAVPSGTDQVWISSAIFDPSTAATNITSWGTPFQGGTTGPAGAAGTNNATVAIYQKSTDSSSAPANPSGTFTYTFSTGVLSAGTFNSWSQTIPTLAKGEYLWMKHATASSTTATDSIPASEFSTAAVTGASGIDGNSVAVVELFQVSTSNSSAPADPSGTFTYTFSNNTLSSGTLNGWSQSVPTVPAGQYLWTIQASAVSDTNTDSIPASEFSAAVVVSAAGATGAAGADSKAVKLTSSKYVIAYDENGLNPSPSSITLTATASNLTNAFFKFTGDEISDESSFTDGSSALSDTFSVSVPAAFADWTNPSTLRVGVSEADQNELAFDTISIPAIQQGSDGYTVVVTNESHTLPASNTGVVSSYSGSGTTISVFKGSTQLTGITSGTPSATQFTVTVANNSNITEGSQSASSNNIVIANHSAMSDSVDSVKIDYTITVRPANSNLNFLKSQTLTKSKVGSIGLTGAAGIDAYTVGLTANKYAIAYDIDGVESDSITFTAAPQGIQGTATYSFAVDGVTKQSASASTTYAMADSDEPASGAAKVVSVSMFDDNVLKATDSVSVYGIQSGSDGATGPTGPRQTTGVVYYTAQSANAPSAPSNGTSGGTSNATWDWSAGNFSTLPNNWSLTPPTPNPTDTNAYWQSAFSSYEATNGGTTNLTFQTPTKIIVFDGIVKFTNSNAITDGTTSTTLPTVFRQSGIPTALAAKDIWIDTDDNQMYSAISTGNATSNWVKTVDTVTSAAAATAQTTANTAVSDAADAQSTADTAVSDASNAQSTANTAASNATAAQGELDDIADDNKLTPVEKLQVKIIWDAIRGEYSGIVAAAIDAGVPSNNSIHLAYSTANTALNEYLNNSTGTAAGDINIFDNNGDLVLSSGELITTTIARSTFNTRFKTYYDTKQALLDAIAAILKDRADLGVDNAAIANTAAGNAQTAANTAQSAADSKTKTFRQNGEPSSGMSEGDLWFDTDAENQLYLFDGTDWIREDFAALIDAHTTTINGGKITTGTISSNKIDANKIDAAKLSLNSELTIQNNAGIKSGKDSAADTSIGVFLGTDNSGEFALVTASGSGDSASAVTISAAQTILKNPIIQTGTSVSDTPVTRTTTGTNTITADPSHEDSGGTNPFQKLTVSAVGGGGSGARGNSGGNGNTGGTTLVTIARTVTGSTSTARAAAVTAMAAIQDATLSLSGSGGAGGVGSSGSYSAGAATGSATLGLGAGGDGGVGSSSGMNDYFGGAGGAAGNVDTAIIDIKNLKEVAWEAAGNSDSSVTAPTSGDPSGTNLPSIVFTISTTQIGAAGAQLTGGTSPGGAASTGGMGYVTDSGVLSQLNLDSLAGVSAQDSTISLSGDSNANGVADFTVNQSTAETITIAGGTGITTVGDGTEGSSSITINLDSTIASNTTGNATTATTSTFVSGTVGLGNGGTGATSAAAARANLGSPILIESDSGNADPVASDFTSGIYFVVQY